MRDTYIIKHIINYIDIYIYIYQMGKIFDIYLSDGFKLVINKGRKDVGNM